ncbi:c-type cytochrome [Ferrigenium sp. UT5]|uniref:c-type cytochrome n=1 Tax=Ferrigenium sp. UT5 TaxID=3242105 RepID=UPI0035531162
MANIRMAALLVSMTVSLNSNAADAPRIEIPATVQTEMKALACDACHGLNRTKFGPSWQDISDRYRNDATYTYKGFDINSTGETLPLVQGLVKKVSKGGKGEWNEYIPMAPGDPHGTHAREITHIVNFILSIPPKR